jgi:hypothetical protein
MFYTLKLTAMMENERPMQAREIGAYLSKKEPRLMDRTDAVRILLHTCAMAVPWGGSRVSRLLASRGTTM